MPKPQIRPYPKNTINSMFAISTYSPEETPPKQRKKKTINPLIIEAVLKTVQASKTPLEIGDICKQHRWINSIPAIQSAAKLLAEQGKIKVTRYCGYSVYEKISDG